MRKGQFDVGMDGITIKDDRKKQIDFSDAYMVSEQFMMVRANEKRFTDAKGFGPTPSCWWAHRTAPPTSTPRCTRCWTATRRTHASSCMKPLACPCRRSLLGDVDTVLSDGVSSQGYVKAFPASTKW